MSDDNRGHVSVTAEIYERLRAESKRLGVPMSQLVEKVLAPVLSGTLPTPRELYAQVRRATNASAGKCINGVGHGKATNGKLCRRCRLVHQHGREKGLAIWDREQNGKPLRADHSHLLQGVTQ